MLKELQTCMWRSSSGSVSLQDQHLQATFKINEIFKKIDLSPLAKLRRTVLQVQLCD